ncbi:hypothetical protein [Flagellimonas flava]|uniref:hypothetical protein n=1 Tax=Flagellimonas flava TaxID=570519 RepID=UPI003D64DD30
MPERENVIVLVKNGEPVGVYGSVKDMCEKNLGFSYYYLREKSTFPYEYKEYKIYKIKFR